MSVQSVQLRINCMNPPTNGEFGLQSKPRDIEPGERLADGSLMFAFELKVKQHDNGKPNFTGPYAHGTVQERFVYLTLVGERRIKVHLKTISWDQVEAVLSSAGAYLEVSVDGQGAASVPLLGDGWVVQEGVTE